MEASNSKQRFSDRVDDYIRARPNYPAEVIGVLQDEIALASDWAVADVGSGTGISAELFINNGNTVYAVEPNDEMRAAAEARLGSNEKFNSVNGSAEATTLADKCVDLIVAAQAFHWFDVPAFAKECRRIGRDDAWSVLMWNDRDEQSSAFAIDYEKLLGKFGTDYKTLRHQRLTRQDLGKFFSGDFFDADLPNQQVLDLDGLRGRLLSSSYMPLRGQPNYEPMMAELDEIFATHAVNGQVTLRYRTRLHVGHAK